MLSWSSFDQYASRYSTKPLAAFPHNHCRNNGQRWERNESCRNDYRQSSETEYWQSLGSNQRPPVLKSATLPTELWGSTLVLGYNINYFSKNISRIFLTIYTYISFLVDPRSQFFSVQSDLDLYCFGKKKLQMWIHLAINSSSLISTFSLRIISLLPHNASFWRTQDT